VLGINIDKGYGLLIVMRDDAGNLRRSLEVAWQALAGQDIADISRRSAGILRDRDIIIEFMGTEYVVSVENESLTLNDGSGTNPFFEAIILHYLVNAKDIPKGDRKITFRELDGGGFYYGAFYNRTIAPLIDRFGEDPGKLIPAGLKAGGSVIDMGDAAVKIAIFPKISLYVVLWEGDDEVAPNVNVLFDSTSGYHLPTEDMAALGSMVASQLIRNAD